MTDTLESIIDKLSREEPRPEGVPCWQSVPSVKIEVLGYTGGGKLSIALMNSKRRCIVDILANKCVGIKHERELTTDETTE